MKGYLNTSYAHFPSIGSDDPSPPLGVENVKIQENSEKIRGPLQPVLGPLRSSDP